VIRAFLTLVALFGVFRIVAFGFSARSARRRDRRYVRHRLGLISIIAVVGALVYLVSQLRQLAAEVLLLGVCIVAVSVIVNLARR